VQGSRSGRVLSTRENDGEENERARVQSRLLEPDASGMTSEQKKFMCGSAGPGENRYACSAAFTCDLHALADWLQEVAGFAPWRWESGRVLDSTISDTRKQEVLEVYLGQCALLEKCSRAKHVPIVSGFSTCTRLDCCEPASARHGHLCGAFPLETSSKSAANGLPSTSCICRNLLAR